MIKKILNHPLFSGSVIMVGGNLAANGVNYLYHILMGRTLGPVNYGVLASIFSILYLISVIPTSASIAIVKFISSAKSSEEVSLIYFSVRKITQKLSWILALSFLAVSPLISKFLNINSFWDVSLVAPVIFLSLMTVVNQATAQGLLHFFGNAGPNIVSAVVKLGLGLPLVLLGWSVFGAMVGVVTGGLLAFFYSIYFLKKYITSYKDGKYNLVKMGKYSLPVVIQAFAFTSLFSTDVILVKHFLSPLDAGLYGALSTLGKIIFFATSPIAATMFPIVSGRKSRGESFTKVLFVSFGLTFLISILIVAFYLIFPNIAIGVLYGASYLVATKWLPWMGFFILFYSLSYFLVNYLLSIGDTKSVAFAIAAAILQVPAIWIFHVNILQVIQICLGLSVVLFLGLLGYLGYTSVIYGDKH